ncbi:hypothetical protein KSP40_PGU011752 [Platanthera guangdongensis]|uniref:O-fucosyltransferase family protein n=1 Tax=Platanthera guangdongensis TaxID=2320717 RepID=A0ABR2MSN5_9ASPA
MPPWEPLKTPISWKQHVRGLAVAFPLLLILFLFFFIRPQSFPLPLAGNLSSLPSSHRRSAIWSASRSVEWRPCSWWTEKATTALPAGSNGYIRVDCYGGLNQMRRDFCDGVGIARLLNATLVLPKFEVAAYWNESSGFGDIFDVDYFIEQTKGFVEIVKELPDDLASREPVKVDCSKRTGNFDYVEAVLPALKNHHYISITPAMSQRRDSGGNGVNCIAVGWPSDAGEAEASSESRIRGAKTTNLAVYRGIPFMPGLPCANPATGLFALTRPWKLKVWSFLTPFQNPSSPSIYDSSQIWSLIANASTWDSHCLLGSYRCCSRGSKTVDWRCSHCVEEARKMPSHTKRNRLHSSGAFHSHKHKHYLAAGDGLMEIEGLTSIYTNVYSKNHLCLVMESL